MPLLTGIAPTADIPGGAPGGTRHCWVSSQGAVSGGRRRRPCESHEHRTPERFGELFATSQRVRTSPPGHANRLIELTKRLTYPQLLLLGLFYEPADGMLDSTPSGAVERALG